MCTTRVRCRRRHGNFISLFVEKLKFNQHLKHLYKFNNDNLLLLDVNRCSIQMENAKDITSVDAGKSKTISIRNMLTRFVVTYVAMMKHGG
jgi:hypothetical protein